MFGSWQHWIAEVVPTIDRASSQETESPWPMANAYDANGNTSTKTDSTGTTNYS